MAGSEEASNDQPVVPPPPSFSSARPTDGCIADCDVRTRGARESENPALCSLVITLGVLPCAEGPSSQNEDALAMRRIVCGAGDIAYCLTCKNEKMEGCVCPHEPPPEFKDSNPCTATVIMDAPTPFSSLSTDKGKSAGGTGNLQLTSQKPETLPTILSQEATSSYPRPPCSAVSPQTCRQQNGAKRKICPNAKGRRKCECKILREPCSCDKVKKSCVCPSNECICPPPCKCKPGKPQAVPKSVYLARKRQEVEITLSPPAQFASSLPNDETSDQRKAFQLDPTMSADPQHFGMSDRHEQGDTTLENLTDDQRTCDCRIYLKYCTCEIADRPCPCETSPCTCEGRCTCPPKVSLKLRTITGTTTRCEATSSEPKLKKSEQHDRKGEHSKSYKDGESKFIDPKKIVSTVLPPMVAECEGLNKPNTECSCPKELDPCPCTDVPDDVLKKYFDAIKSQSQSEFSKMIAPQQFREPQSTQKTSEDANQNGVESEHIIQAPAQFQNEPQGGGEPAAVSGGREISPVPSSYSAGDQVQSGPPIPPPHHSEYSTDISQTDGQVEQQRSQERYKQVAPEILIVGELECKCNINCSGDPDCDCENREGFFIKKGPAQCKRLLKMGVEALNTDDHSSLLELTSKRSADPCTCETVCEGKGKKSTRGKSNGSNKSNESVSKNVSKSNSQQSQNLHKSGGNKMMTKEDYPEVLPPPEGFRESGETSKGKDQTKNVCRNTGQKRSSCNARKNKNVIQINVVPDNQQSNAETQSACNPNRQQQDRSLIQSGGNIIETRSAPESGFQRDERCKYVSNCACFPDQPGKVVRQQPTASGDSHQNNESSVPFPYSSFDSKSPKLSTILEPIEGAFQINSLPCMCDECKCEPICEYIQKESIHEHAASGDVSLNYLPSKTHTNDSLGTHLINPVSPQHFTSSTHSTRESREIPSRTQSEPLKQLQTCLCEQECTCSLGKPNKILMANSSPTKSAAENKLFRCLCFPKCVCTVGKPNKILVENNRSMQFPFKVQSNLSTKEKQLANPTLNTPSFSKPETTSPYSLHRKQKPDSQQELLISTDETTESHEYTTSYTDPELHQSQTSNSEAHDEIMSKKQSTNSKDNNQNTTPVVMTDTNLTSHTDTLPCTCIDCICTPDNILSECFSEYTESGVCEASAQNLYTQNKRIHEEVPQEANIYTPIESKQVPSLPCSCMCKCSPEDHEHICVTQCVSSTPIHKTTTRGIGYLEYEKQVCSKIKKPCTYVPCMCTDCKCTFGNIQVECLPRYTECTPCTSLKTQMHTSFPGTENDELCDTESVPCMCKECKCTPDNIDKDCLPNDAQYNFTSQKDKEPYYSFPKIAEEGLYNTDSVPCMCSECKCTEDDIKKECLPKRDKEITREITKYNPDSTLTQNYEHEQEHVSSKTGMNLQPSGDDVICQMDSVPCMCTDCKCTTDNIQKECLPEDTEYNIPDNQNHTLIDINSKNEISKSTPTNEYNPTDNLSQATSELLHTRNTEDIQRENELPKEKSLNQTENMQQSNRNIKDEIILAPAEEIPNTAKGDIPKLQSHASNHSESIRSKSRKSIEDITSPRVDNYKEIHKSSPINKSNDLLHESISETDRGRQIEMTAENDATEKNIHTPNFRINSDVQLQQIPPQSPFERKKCSCECARQGQRQIQKINPKLTKDESGHELLLDLRDKTAITTEENNKFSNNSPQVNANQHSSLAGNEPGLQGSSHSAQNATSQTRLSSSQTVSTAQLHSGYIHTQHSGLSTGFPAHTPRDFVRKEVDASKSCICSGECICTPQNPHKILVSTQVPVQALDTPVKSTTPPAHGQDKWPPSHISASTSNVPGPGYLTNPTTPGIQVTHSADTVTSHPYSSSKKVICLSTQNCKCAKCACTSEAVRHDCIPENFQLTSQSRSIVCERVSCICTPSHTQECCFLRDVGRYSVREGDKYENKDKVTEHYINQHMIISSSDLAAKMANEGNLPCICEDPCSCTPNQPSKVLVPNTKSPPSNDQCICHLPCPCHPGKPNRVLVPNKFGVSEQVTGYPASSTQIRIVSAPDNACICTPTCCCEPGYPSRVLVKDAQGDAANTHIMGIPSSQLSNYSNELFTHTMEGTASESKRCICTGICSCEPNHPNRVLVKNTPSKIEQPILGPQSHYAGMQQSSHSVDPFAQATNTPKSTQEILEDSCVCSNDCECDSGTPNPIYPETYIGGDPNIISPPQQFSQHSKTSIPDQFQKTPSSNIINPPDRFSQTNVDEKGSCFCIGQCDCTIAASKNRITSTTKQEPYGYTGKNTPTQSERGMTDTLECICPGDCTCTLGNPQRIVGNELKSSTSNMPFDQNDIGNVYNKTSAAQSHEMQIISLGSQTVQNKPSAQYPSAQGIPPVLIKTPSTQDGFPACICEDPCICEPGKPNKVLKPDVDIQIAQPTPVVSTYNSDEAFIVKPEAFGVSANPISSTERDGTMFPTNRSINSKVSDMQSPPPPYGICKCITTTGKCLCSYPKCPCDEDYPCTCRQHGWIPSQTISPSAVVSRGVTELSPSARHNYSAHSQTVRSPQPSSHSHGDSIPCLCVSCICTPELIQKGCLPDIVDGDRFNTPNAPGGPSLHSGKFSKTETGEVDSIPCMCIDCICVPEDIKPGCIPPNEDTCFDSQELQPSFDTGSRNFPEGEIPCHCVECVCTPDNIQDSCVTNVRGEEKSTTNLPQGETSCHCVKCVCTPDNIQDSCVTNVQGEEKSITNLPQGEIPCHCVKCVCTPDNIQDSCVTNVQGEEKSITNLPQGEIPCHCVECFCTPDNIQDSCVTNVQGEEKSITNLPQGEIPCHCVECFCTPDNIQDSCVTNVQGEEKSITNLPQGEIPCHCVECFCTPDNIPDTCVTNVHGEEKSIMNLPQGEIPCHCAQCFCTPDKIPDTCFTTASILSPKPSKQSPSSGNIQGVQIEISRDKAGNLSIESEECMCQTCKCTPEFIQEGCLPDKNIFVGSPSQGLPVGTQRVKPCVCNDPCPCSPDQPNIVMMSETSIPTAYLDGKMTSGIISTQMSGVMRPDDQQYPVTSPGLSYHASQIPSSHSRREIPKSCLCGNVCPCTPAEPNIVMLSETNIPAEYAHDIHGPSVTKGYAPTTSNRSVPPTDNSQIPSSHSRREIPKSCLCGNVCPCTPAEPNIVMLSETNIPAEYAYDIHGPSATKVYTPTTSNHSFPPTDNTQFGQIPSSEEYSSDYSFNEGPRATLASQLSQRRLRSILSTIECGCTECHCTSTEISSTCIPPNKQSILDELRGPAQPIRSTTSKSPSQFMNQINIPTQSTHITHDNTAEVKPCVCGTVCPCTPQQPNIVMMSVTNIPAAYQQTEGSTIISTHTPLSSSYYQPQGITDQNNTHFNISETGMPSSLTPITSRNVPGYNNKQSPHISTHSRPQSSHTYPAPPADAVTSVADSIPCMCENCYCTPEKIAPGCLPDSLELVEDTVDTLNIAKHEIGPSKSCMCVGDCKCTPDESSQFEGSKPHILVTSQHSQLPTSHTGIQQPSAQTSLPHSTLRSQDPSTRFPQEKTSTTESIPCYCDICICSPELIQEGCISIETNKAFQQTTAIPRSTDAKDTQLLSQKSGTKPGATPCICVVDCPCTPSNPNIVELPDTREEFALQRGVDTSTPSFHVAKPDGSPKSITSRSGRSVASQLSVKTLQSVLSMIPCSCDECYCTDETQAPTCVSPADQAILDELRSPVLSKGSSAVRNIGDQKQPSEHLGMGDMETSCTCVAECVCTPENPVCPLKFDVGSEQPCTCVDECVCTPDNPACPLTFGVGSEQPCTCVDECVCTPENPVCPLTFGVGSEQPCTCVDECVCTPENPVCPLKFGVESSQKLGSKPASVKSDIGSEQPCTCVGECVCTPENPTCASKFGVESSQKLGSKAASVKSDIGSEQPCTCVGECVCTPENPTCASKFGVESSQKLGSKPPSVKSQVGSENLCTCVGECTCTPDNVTCPSKFGVESSQKSGSKLPSVKSQVGSENLCTCVGECVCSPENPACPSKFGVESSQKLGSIPPSVKSQVGSENLCTCVGECVCTPENVTCPSKFGVESSQKLGTKPPSVMSQVSSKPPSVKSQVDSERLCTCVGECVCTPENVACPSKFGVESSQKLGSKPPTVKSDVGSEQPCTCDGICVCSPENPYCPPKFSVEPSQKLGSQAASVKSDVGSEQPCTCVGECVCTPENPACLSKVGVESSQKLGSKPPSVKSEVASEHLCTCVDECTCTPESVTCPSKFGVDSSQKLGSKPPSVKSDVRSEYTCTCVDECVCTAENPTCPIRSETKLSQKLSSGPHIAGTIDSQQSIPCMCVECLCSPETIGDGCLPQGITLDSLREIIKPVTSVLAKPCTCPYECSCLPDHSQRAAMPSNIIGGTPDIEDASHNQPSVHSKYSSVPAINSAAAAESSKQNLCLCEEDCICTAQKPEKSQTSAAKSDKQGNLCAARSADQVASTSVQSINIPVHSAHVPAGSLNTPDAPSMRAPTSIPSTSTPVTRVSGKMCICIDDCICLPGEQNRVLTPTPLGEVGHSQSKHSQMNNASMHTAKSCVCVGECSCVLDSCSNSKETPGRQDQNTGNGNKLKRKIGDNLVSKKAICECVSPSGDIRCSESDEPCPCEIEVPCICGDACETTCMRAIQGHLGGGSDESRSLRLCTCSNIPCICKASLSTQKIYSYSQKYLNTLKDLSSQAVALVNLSSSMNVHGNKNNENLKDAAAHFGHKTEGNAGSMYTNPEITTHQEEKKTNESDRKILMSIGSNTLKNYMFDNVREIEQNDMPSPAVYSLEPFNGPAIDYINTDSIKETGESLLRGFQNKTIHSSDHLILDVVNSIDNGEMVLKTSAKSNDNDSYGSKAMLQDQTVKLVRSVAEGTEGLNFGSTMLAKRDTSNEAEECNKFTVGHSYSTTEHQKYDINAANEKWECNQKLNSKVDENIMNYKMCPLVDFMKINISDAENTSTFEKLVEKSYSVSELPEEISNSITADGISKLTTLYSMHDFDSGYSVETQSTNSEKCTRNSPHCNSTPPQIATQTSNTSGALEPCDEREDSRNTKKGTIEYEDLVFTQSCIHEDIGNKYLSNFFEDEDKGKSALEFVYKPEVYLTKPYFSYFDKYRFSGDKGIAEYTKTTSGLSAVTISQNNSKSEEDSSLYYGMCSKQENENDLSKKANVIQKENTWCHLPVEEGYCLNCRNEYCLFGLEDITTNEEHFSTLQASKNYQGFGVYASDTPTISSLSLDAFQSSIIIADQTISQISFDSPLCEICRQELIAERNREKIRGFHEPIKYSNNYLVSQDSISDDVTIHIEAPSVQEKVDHFFSYLTHPDIGMNELQGKTVEYCHECNHVFSYTLQSSNTEHLAGGADDCVCKRNRRKNESESECSCIERVLGQVRSPAQDQIPIGRQEDTSKPMSTNISENPPSRGAINDCICKQNLRNNTNETESQCNCIQEMLDGLNSTDQGTGAGDKPGESEKLISNNIPSVGTANNNVEDIERKSSDKDSKQNETSNSQDHKYASISKDCGDPCVPCGCNDEGEDPILCHLINHSANRSKNIPTNEKSYPKLRDTDQGIDPEHAESSTSKGVSVTPGPHEEKSNFCRMYSICSVCDGEIIVQCTCETLQNKSTLGDGMNLPEPPSQKPSQAFDPHEGIVLQAPEQFREGSSTKAGQENKGELNKTPCAEECDCIILYQTCNCELSDEPCPCEIVESCPCVNECICEQGDTKELPQDVSTTFPNGPALDLRKDANATGGQCYCIEIMKSCACATSNARCICEDEETCNCPDECACVPEDGIGMLDHDNKSEVSRSAASGGPSGYQPSQETTATSSKTGGPSSIFTKLEKAADNGPGGDTKCSEKCNPCVCSGDESDELYLCNLINNLRNIHQSQYPPTVSASAQTAPTYASPPPATDEKGGAPGVSLEQLPPCGDGHPPCGSCSSERYDDCICPPQLPGLAAPFSQICGEEIPEPCKYELESCTCKSNVMPVKVIVRSADSRPRIGSPLSDRLPPCGDGHPPCGSCSSERYDDCICPPELPGMNGTQPVICGDEIDEKKHRCEIEKLEDCTCFPTENTNLGASTHVATHSPHISAHGAQPPTQISQTSARPEINVPEDHTINTVKGMRVGHVTGQCAPQCNPCSCFEESDDPILCFLINVGHRNVANNNRTDNNLQNSKGNQESALYGAESGGADTQCPCGTPCKCEEIVKEFIKKNAVGLTKVQVPPETEFHTPTVSGGVGGVPVVQDKESRGPCKKGELRLVGGCHLAGITTISHSATNSKNPSQLSNRVSSQNTVKSNKNDDNCKHSCICVAIVKRFIAEHSKRSCGEDGTYCTPEQAVKVDRCSCPEETAIYEPLCNECQNGVNICTDCGTYIPSSPITGSHSAPATIVVQNVESTKVLSNDCTALKQTDEYTSGECGCCRCPNIVLEAIRKFEESRMKGNASSHTPIHSSVPLEQGSRQKIEIPNICVYTKYNVPEECLAKKLSQCTCPPDANTLCKVANTSSCTQSQHQRSRQNIPIPNKIEISNAYVYNEYNVPEECLAKKLSQCTCPPDVNALCKVANTSSCTQSQHQRSRQNIPIPNKIEISNACVYNEYNVPEECLAKKLSQCTCPPDANTLCKVANTSSCTQSQHQRSRQNIQIPNVFGNLESNVPAECLARKLSDCTCNPEVGPFPHTRTKRYNLQEEGCGRGNSPCGVCDNERYDDCTCPTNITNTSKQMPEICGEESPQTYNINAEISIPGLPPSKLAISGNVCGDGISPCDVCDIERYDDCICPPQLFGIPDVIVGVCGDTSPQGVQPTPSEQASPKAALDTGICGGGNPPCNVCDTERFDDCICPSQPLVTREKTTAFCGDEKCPAANIVLATLNPSQLLLSTGKTTAVCGDEKCPAANIVLATLNPSQLLLSTGKTTAVCGGDNGAAVSIVPTAQNIPCSGDNQETCGDDKPPCGVCDTERYSDCHCPPQLPGQEAEICNTTTDPNPTFPPRENTQFKRKDEDSDEEYCLCPEIPDEVLQSLMGKCSSTNNLKSKIHRCGCTNNGTVHEALFSKIKNEDHGTVLSRQRICIRVKRVCDCITPRGLPSEARRPMGFSNSTTKVPVDASQPAATIRCASGEVPPEGAQEAITKVTTFSGHPVTSYSCTNEGVCPARSTPAVTPKSTPYATHSLPADASCRDVPPRSCGRTKQSGSSSSGTTASSASMATTPSTMKTTIYNLVSKCELKDKMIECLLTELSRQGNTRHVYQEMLECIANKKTPCPQPSRDYTRVDLCRALPRPEATFTGCRSSNAHTQDAGQEASPPMAAAPICVCTGKGPTATACGARNRGAGPESLATDDVGAEKKGARCRCNAHSDGDGISEITTVTSKFVPTKDDLPEQSDESPLNFHVVRRVAADGLIVGWSPPPDSLPDLCGYEVFVDGALRYRARSGTRDLAYISGLDLRHRHVLTLYPLSCNADLAQKSASAMYDPKRMYGASGFKKRKRKRSRSSKRRKKSDCECLMESFRNRGGRNQESTPYAYTLTSSNSNSPNVTDTS